MNENKKQMPSLQAKTILGFHQKRNDTSLIRSKTYGCLWLKYTLRKALTKKHHLGAVLKVTEKNEQDVISLDKAHSCEALITALEEKYMPHVSLRKPETGTCTSTVPH
eukprot:GHVR01000913.1.p1 GENE.GHVR01000913.1~~GHVR01000913.1.p1  ORF type:complete len:108 (-),score=8.44 GHVR01000913.1:271-594(-)